MSKIIWNITRDHFDDRAVDIMGPSGINREDVTLCTVPFKLYDDDGELMLSGKMSPTCDFEPLEHYGMPAYGCTGIKLKGKNGWEWL